VIHRWRTLHRSHPSHFRRKQCHNRSQHCIYYHRYVCYNVQDHRFSTSYHIDSKHHATRSVQHRMPRHVSEATAIWLLSINCCESSTTYTEFDWRRYSKFVKLVVFVKLMKMTTCENWQLEWIKKCETCTFTIFSKSMYCET